MDDIAQRYKGHHMNSYQILLNPIARKKRQVLFENEHLNIGGPKSDHLLQGPNICKYIYIYRDT